MIVGIFLPFIANTAGWIMTEIGRQPWTVFGLSDGRGFRITECDGE